MEEDNETLLSLENINGKVNENGEDNEKHENGKNSKEQEENSNDIQIKESSETTQKGAVIPCLSKNLFDKKIWTKKALISSLLYSLVGFKYIIFSEVFPVWSIADIAKGGLSFSSSDIGIVGAFIGIILILFQFALVIIIKKLGLLRTFQCGTILSLIAFTGFPFLNVVIQHVPKIVFWVILLASYAFQQFCGILEFSSIIQSIQNSVLPEHAGTVNGFAQSLVAFWRATGPFLGGSILAWSFGNGLSIPFDFHFTFFMLDFIAIIIFCISLKQSKNINIPQKEIEEQLLQSEA